VKARTFGVGWGTALVLSLVLVGDAWAQGSVTGRIVQASSLRPLAGAQVSIPGTGIGALANNEGRYLLVNVPVGQHTVRVEIIGFGTQERSVTVAAGQSAALDFQLETQALGLDEIVVTGTAGGVQRRAIGNVVATVSAEKQLETRNPESVQTLLSGSTPGVMINVGVGNVGAGGGMVIRGMSSMGGSGSAVLTSAPILIIDGVRANGGTDSQSSGGATSRLNDINPEDIERIEIIKGPAAATLYGTEATNGVIQIVTKKGALGAGTTVDASLRQGASWFNNPHFPDNYGLAADGKTILIQNPYNDEIAAGNKIFRTGRLSSYGLSMRGGQQRLSYFMSGAYDNDEGYFNNNELTRMSLRTNMQLALSDRFDLSGDVGVISSDTDFADTGTGGTSGMMAMILWGTPATKDTPSRGFMVGPPEYQDMIQSDQKMNRQTASITAAYRATEWLAQRLVVGFDRTDLVASKFFPKADQPIQFYAGESAGHKSVNNEREVHQTIDYNITASLEPMTNMTSATSFGVQYFAKSELRTLADGRTFSTPSVSTVTAGSVRTATEGFEENKTFGVFVQETVGWRNQAFLTAAIRGDANSAFGESFDAAYYPKLSGTWTVSDAVTLPSVSSMRLRAAWGRSGLQPTTFAAIRTYEPLIAAGDASGVRPGNVGNPDLKPEVATELELGLDAALFNNRATIEISRYGRVTRDAILNQEVAPSDGFLGTKYVNVGEISNHGWEFKLDVTPIQTSGIQLTLGGSLSLNKNKIEDLGGLVIAADTRGRWQNLQGYEIGSMWSKYVHTAEWGGATGTTLTNIKCYGGPPGGKNLPAEDMGKYPDQECANAPLFYFGSPGPNRNGGLTQTLSLGSALTFNANWVYWGDSRTFSTTEWYRDKTQANSYYGVQRRLGKMDPVRAAAIQLADIDHVYMSRDDFLRLREVSVSYNLPTAWVQGFGVSRASLLVSAQNMYMWVHPDYTDQTDGKFKNLDPEARAPRSVLYGFQQATSILPHSVTTTLRMTF
jgi:TonB-linked SusC/RagA family outer membrane protein